MKKIIATLIGFAILFSIPCLPNLAMATSATNSSNSTIQSLLDQIEILKAQIEALQTQLQTFHKSAGEVKEAKQEIKSTLRITRQLWKGLRNEDVTLLQEILATDPDIYPEGLVTGYFGPLTERAVKRFQKMAGIEQVGRMGPKTMAKINELLEEGAGSSGKVPPGLLIAPGIRKKLSYQPQPLPDQKLPPGIAKKLDSATTTPATTTPDTTAPIISELLATSTMVTSTVITWITDEEADSKVWYDTITPLVVSTSTPIVSSSELTSDHSLTLSSLTADTTYYYIVSSADASDNTVTSDEFSFTTLSE